MNKYRRLYNYRNITCMKCLLVRWLGFNGIFGIIRLYSAFRNYNLIKRFRTISAPLNILNNGKQFFRCFVGGTTEMYLD